MSNLCIEVCPSSVLRRKTSDVEEINTEIISLADNMIHTMYEASGIGLAAPQVGVSKKLIVLDISYKNSQDGKNPIVLINPKIIAARGELIDEEGCLSIPKVYGKVIRAAEIEVEALSPDNNKITFTANGLLARAIQHEIDHINGLLFWDRVAKSQRDILKKRYKDLLPEKG